jgi:hypothetical protein
MPSQTEKTAQTHNYALKPSIYTTHTQLTHCCPGIMVATFGALVLVQLIRQGGADSPAYQIGYHLSGALAQVGPALICSKPLTEHPLLVHL